VVGFVFWMAGRVAVLYHGVWVGLVSHL
jgi:hypothetical protein